MSYSIKINNAKLKQKLAKVKKLNKSIRVGFLSSEIAKIARWNNYGTVIPVTNKMRAYFRYHFKHSIGKDKTVLIIPPRPFMTKAFDNNKSEYLDRLKFAVNKNIEQALEILAVSIEDDIRTSIAEGGWVDNSPMTIALKGKNTPLIHTGALSQYIDHEIT